MTAQPSGAGVAPTDADRIREQLEILGLSQREAARALGIDDRSMRYYCAGQMPVPSAVILALRYLEQMQRNQQCLTLLADGTMSTSDGEQTAERLQAANHKLKSAIDILLRAPQASPAPVADAARQPREAAIVAFELIYPGTFVEIADRDEMQRVQALLHSGETCLVEAALALGGYVSACGVLPTSFDAKASWEARAAKRRELQSRIRQQLGVAEYDFTRHVEIALETERLMLRELFASGAMPHKYARQRPFLYAKSFLYSADAVRNVLVQLSKLSTIAGAALPLIADLDAKLPGLTGVRDSTAHADERVQGMAHGKTISLKPVSNQFVQASGGVLISDTLMGDNFGSTLADGAYGEVPVTADTLSLCVSTFQRLLSALPWTGPPRLVPDPS
jgi:hypothetical protein